MEQYADEFERQCVALRSRLATEENKSRHLEAERDALRERCGKLEWLAEVYEFYIKCNVRMRALVEVANTLEDAVSAVEVKP